MFVLCFVKTKRLPAGAVMVQNQKLTLTPGTVYKGSFAHLHPTLIQPMDDRDILFCGYRDGSMSDWMVDDMDISVDFQYAVQN
jgi:hypothetical protein